MSLFLLKSQLTFGQRAIWGLLRSKPACIQEGPFWPLRAAVLWAKLFCRKLLQSCSVYAVFMSFFILICYHRALNAHVQINIWDHKLRLSSLFTITHILTGCTGPFPAFFKKVVFPHCPGRSKKNYPLASIGFDSPKSKIDVQSAGTSHLNQNLTKFSACSVTIVLVVTTQYAILNSYYVLTSLTVCLCISLYDHFSFGCCIPELETAVLFSLWIHNNLLQPCSTLF